MRLYLALSRNRQLVPYNYQPQLTGAIHKWLGQNSWHGTTALFSFSWLQRGESTGKGLSFPHGARLEISAYESDFIKRLIKGVQQDPYLAFGLKATDITIQEAPIFSEKETLFVTSPILIKRTIDNRDIHYTYDDPLCGALLTETLQRKLRIAGIAPDGVKVDFLKDYPGAQTKIIYYNKIGNRVNICPVIIEGTPEQISFAWKTGLGNSTGIGFGALK
ncbi:CRISPR-associated endoribonuclease Cas6 [Chitinophaga sp. 212800010-3]|uniref:CRISPR-associated endoribonuclease Cas6 n=1 Tax=unclassified Chitinophaga TaxID=2619133 RepID=UPI002DE5F079|nr:CRISPR-associated endoribonuclease Cas6 [Chitinophaga sp. 212800010-3]